MLLITNKEKYQIIADTLQHKNMFAAQYSVEYGISLLHDEAKDGNLTHLNVDRLWEEFNGIESEEYNDEEPDEVTHEEFSSDM